MAEPDPSPSFSPRGRWKIRLNVTLSVLALVAIIVMVNYLAARHSRVWHWTSSAPGQLSPVTLEVLHSVTNPVQVIVFYDHTKPLYDFVSDLLKEYQRLSPKLQLEYVDYERSLARARIVEAQYGQVPAPDADRIIFDSGGRTRVVLARELSEYDYSALLKGQEVKRTGFKGEEVFTSALYSLIDPKPVKVCFGQGHGEHDPNAKDTSGYSRVVQILRDQQVAVEILPETALVSSDVTADCQLLIIAGPKHPFRAEELARLQSYLSQGGRMLVLFRFELAQRSTPSGLEKMLGTWGLDIGRNLIIDRAQGQENDPRKIFLSHFANHPILNPLARSRLLMLLPRSVARRTPEPQGSDAPKVTELAFTSSRGSAYGPDGNSAERVDVSLPVLAAVERGAVQGIAADKGATRIVVAGDSHFLSNGFIDYDEANGDFARNAINWLLSRDVLVQGITSRPIKEYRINMTTTELTTVRWLFLVVFPGGVLFLGFLVWLRRRA
jgi:hypothetical protein